MALRVRVAGGGDARQLVEKMRKFEVVQAGSEEEGDARWWGHRVGGSNRRAFLLEREGSADILAYLLMSFAEGPARRMRDVFEGRAGASPDSVSFYSVTSTSEERGAGRAIIQGAAELLRGPEGIRAALPGAPRGLRPLLYTMSPVPTLLRALREEREGLVRPLEAGDEAARPEIEAWLREYLVERREDPVARFHLGNGASLHRVNFGADDHPWRLKQSAGVMVNYDYN